jgi:hypothetical protein
MKFSRRSRLNTCLAPRSARTPKASPKLKSQRCARRIKKAKRIIRIEVGRRQRNVFPRIR